MHGILFFMNYHCDAIHFAVIDPMHNLFLGTSITIWKEHDILNKGDFHTTFSF